MTRTFDEPTAQDSEYSKVLDQLACVIQESPRPRSIIAVDGVDGAGKTMFADALANAICSRGQSVIRASVDGFHHPQRIRYRRGKASPEGFFLDSYNYAAMREHLLRPFRDGASAVQVSCFDHRTDREAPSIEQVDPKSVLLLDGIFLHRDELVRDWDLSIFLDVPFEVSYARMAVRDGSNPNPQAQENDRYLRGQEIYLRMCKPQDRATLLIDNADLARPRIVHDRSSRRSEADND
jgi:uridine kinase